MIYELLANFCYLKTLRQLRVILPIIGSYNSRQFYCLCDHTQTSIMFLFVPSFDCFALYVVATVSPKIPKFIRLSNNYAAGLTQYSMNFSVFIWMFRHFFRLYFNVSQLPISASVPMHSALIAP